MTEADLARRIGRLHGWAARHDEALGWLARSLALLGDRLDAADRPVAALIHIHTGPIHFVRGQYDLALGCVQQTHALCRVTGCQPQATAEETAGCDCCDCAGSTPAAGGLPARR